MEMRYLLGMSALSFTPPERLCDPQGRPYFLWDVDMTDAQFRERLADADPETRGYLIAKLMRQARPDDVFLYVSLSELYKSWDQIEPHLEKKRAFWSWLLDEWRTAGHAA